MTTNNFKVGGTTVTHDSRPFTKQKLKAPHFEDATKPMPPFGKLGEILNNSK